MRGSPLEAMIPPLGTQKPESYAKKWGKIPYALDWGGGVATIGARPSLDRFQAQPIWEMSVYGKSNSRFVGGGDGT